MTSLGSLPRTAGQYWHDLYRHGSIAFVSIVGISVPAGVLVGVQFPHATTFVGLAILSWAVHMGAMYTKDVRSGEHDPDEDQEYTRKEAMTMLSVMLLYFTPVLVATAVVASRMNALSGASLVPLLVALYYPVADFQLLCRYKKSPGGVPVLVLFWAFHALGVMEDLSLNETIDEFVQKPPRLFPTRRPRSPF